MTVYHLPQGIIYQSDRNRRPSLTEFKLNAAKLREGTYDKPFLLISRSLFKRDHLDLLSRQHEASETRFAVTAGIRIHIECRLRAVPETKADLHLFFLLFSKGCLFDLVKGHDNLGQAHIAGEVDPALPAEFFAFYLVARVVGNNYGKVFIDTRRPFKASTSPTAHRGEKYEHQCNAVNFSGHGLSPFMMRRDRMYTMINYHINGKLSRKKLALKTVLYYSAQRLYERHCGYPGGKTFDR